MTGGTSTGPELIVALDVPTADAALALVGRIGDACRFYKVGLELFTAAGPAVVDALHARGADVFLDLKLHDIPNTVAGAARRAARLGVRLLTVHASGGAAMLRAAVDGAGDGAPGSGPPCGVLAVTVLTSLDARAVADAWGRPRVVIADEVVRLAGLAEAAGAHGVVCGGGEAPLVRDRFGGRLAALVPGVRLAAGDAHDQARVVTPARAAAAGARYLVLGRAVTRAAEPAATLAAVRADLATAGH